MLFSLKINIFPTPVESSSVAPIFPHFEDMSSFQRFKPGIVYEHLRPTCLFRWLTHHLILLLRCLLFAALRGSPILLICIVFLLLYLIHLFHHVTHKLSSMNVSRQPCRRNFELSRIIIHGIFFLVLQRLSLLGVNGCTRLIFTLMALSITIKHAWLLLEIDRNMVWIMRRPLLLSPR
jgi:hypothetical protein